MIDEPTRISVCLTLATVLSARYVQGNGASQGRVSSAFLFVITVTVRQCMRTIHTIAWFTTSNQYVPRKQRFAYCPSCEVSVSDSWDCSAFMLMITSYIVPRVCGLRGCVNCALILAVWTVLVAHASVVPTSPYSHLHLPIAVLV
jgi:hypothetical protein